MPIPTSKQALLDAIETNFKRLEDDLATVPVAKVREASLVGHAKGTVMSVHNLVSYLIGWNQLIFTWIEKDQRGEPIDFPATGFKWNQLGALAQKFYADSESLSFDALLQKHLEGKQRIVAFITEQSNRKLYGNPWYEKYTLGRMIQLNTSSPYANARTRLRRWKKVNKLK